MLVQVLDFLLQVLARRCRHARWVGRAQVLGRVDAEPPRKHQRMELVLGHVDPQRRLGRMVLAVRYAGSRVSRYSSAIAQVAAA